MKLISCDTHMGRMESNIDCSCGQLVIGLVTRTIGRTAVRCRGMGVSAVVVLGHPEYYPRFGFLPSSRFGMDSDYQVPEGMFMAMELEPGVLGESAGRAKYHAAFEDL